MSSFHYINILLSNLQKLRLYLI